MTAPAASIPLPTPTPVWHMYRALVGVGLFCGLLIVSVYEFTLPIIQRNKIEDGAVEQVPSDSEASDLVFAGFDADGALVGIALEASGMGYQDIVRVLYGYSFDKQAVIGIRVLESRETPGLGDRVETDTDWLEKNFVALDVRLTADGTALQNAVEFVKPGPDKQPWQIDGISGATITSRAIADMLSESTAVWIARVMAQRTDFRLED